MAALFRIDNFANPEALFLLLIIPGYLFWYFRYFRKQRLVIRLSYDPARLNKPRFGLTSLRFIPRVLQILALTCMIIAIARPQTAREVISQQSEGIDIMLLLDTSGSMESVDLVPSRLESAKSTAKSFVSGRPQDRIGIVVFAEEAFSYVPLTLDHSLVKNQISDISAQILPRQGTAIGSAIAVGINRMRDSENPSKVMILLTDGANNRGQIDPITAARLAAQNQIRMHCIGIGTTAKVSRARNGMVELDEQTLQQVAAITGGKYFRATDDAKLDAIFSTISQMEPLEVQEQYFKEVKDHYPFYVKMAIIMLLVAYILMLTFMYNPIEQ